MDFGLTGKAALVTGGSLGIGRATAEELAANGVSVCIVARDGERLRQVAEEISKSKGIPVVAISADLSKREDIEAAIEQATRALGKIDILVNNAGASPAGRIHELTDEQWRASFELKLMGYMRCARAVLPAMQSRRWGRIINVIGRGGDIPTPAYLLGAFNAAVIHFTRALGLEAAQHQVLVNGVSPGAVNTPRWHSIVAQKAAATGRRVEDVVKEWTATVPLGRAAEPSDVADLIAFLCSTRARHIAGTVVNIDGGGAAGV
jgi:3-oxoacyl-[acyl-carrier protein] reductase